RGDSLLAYSFYGQGTRFLDARNPRDIRQVGYYRPDDANAFASYWHKGYVVIADFTRGIDIVTFASKTKTGGRSALPTVVAPPRRGPAPLAFRMAPQWANLCPVAPTSI
ncbi:MAG TPA: hypothetical protein VNB94_12555, partial [Mycobacteriales bacterium]|nr:hypothetical protein [Mycobacteriales bacterium]